MTGELLQIRDLNVEFSVAKSWIPAVRGVDLNLAPDAVADDIVQPGHIFPLMAQPGGVLARAGHTEAAVDLACLAGLEPAGVLVEIMG